VPSRISLLDGEHFGSVAADSPRKTMLEAHQAISHGLLATNLETRNRLPNSKRFVVESWRCKAAAMTIPTRRSSLAHRSMSCEQRGRRGGGVHFRRS
jgi:hypothetical protein